VLSRRVFPAVLLFPFARRNEVDVTCIPQKIEVRLPSSASFVHYFTLDSSGRLFHARSPIPSFSGRRS